MTTRTAQGSNARENIPVALLPGFLCGLYYTHFLIPEDWQPQSDVEFYIYKHRQTGSVPSQTLTFSVGSAAAAEN